MQRGVSQTTVAIVVIVVLIVAGLAFWALSREEKASPTPVSPPASTPSPASPTTIAPSKPTTASSPVATSTPPKAKRVLRVGFAFPTYIDPAVGSDFSSSTALTQLYDPLVWPLPNGSVKPWVAESWSVSEDGLVWTFKIRKGIKFHSGNELTAEDVAFSMERLLTIGQGYAYIFKPYIKEVKVIDKYTVQFVLNKPWGGFLNALIRLYIVDKKTVLQHIKKPGPYGEYGDFATEWLTYHDAGSGPYMAVDVDPQKYVKMVKFEDYWNKEAFAPNAPDEVIFLATAGAPTTELTMFAKRELEIGDQWLPEETLREIAKIKGVSIAKIPMPGQLYLMFNTKKPPLDDVHVRRALAYAFEYDVVIKQLYPDQKPAEGPIPHVLPGWCPVGRYETNLEKAKEELKKSKYWPDIVNNPDKYVIEFWWIAEVPQEEKIALLFAKDASQLGLKVKVVKTPWAKMVEYAANWTSAPHATLLFDMAPYPDAGALLWAKYSSATASSWEQIEFLLNESLDKWIQEAMSILDPKARYEEYCKIAKYINDIAPSLFLFDYVVRLPYQSYYVKWPQAEDPSKVVPAIGYNIVAREIEILLDKKAELVGG
jgi:peptide/nickel transport system substrate-binding protein